MLKIKDGFVIRNIVDEWIIIPVGQQENTQARIMTVNETGHFLWDILEKGATETELLARLLEEYDVDEATAKADISSFVSQLQDQKIL